jgi:hypothetical protein
MSRILLAVAACAVTGSPVLAGPADLFENKVKDFGVTPRGPVLTHYFLFTNNTKQTLTLGQPRVSCGCTSAALLKNQIAPGETSAVVAYMDTRRIQTPGVTKAVLIYVPFFSPSQEEVTLKVQTVCRDDLMFAPDTLAFGTVRKGQTPKATTKVTFTSDPKWEIKKCTSTGAYVHVEHKVESRNGSSVTYEITATLDKNCPAGNWTSDVNLETSNPAVAKLRIPVTVNVTAPVAVTPGAVQFGDLAPGAGAEQQVTLKSDTPFKILKVNGADEQLEVKVDSPEAKAVHTLTVSANPKDVGGFERTVELVTDNKDQPKVVIPVAGKVVPRQMP